jgi:XRE family transcriptional regulator, regulator of sulfur utilization
LCYSAARREGLMGTKFSEWAEVQKANETPAQAELRRRFEAGFALGLQFTEARQARGLTQRELSEITGVAQADISRIERGAGNPTEATLQRLAAALGRKLGLVDAA